MSEGHNWGVPPNMPPPVPPGSMPPPPPGFEAPPPPHSTMPPPVPGTGAASQFGPMAPMHAAAPAAPTSSTQMAYPEMYLRPDKSLGLAYVLWLFLGIFGAHYFYMGKWKLGLLYLFTGGILMLGWIVDLFTLPWQLKRINAKRRAGVR